MKLLQAFILCATLTTFANAQGTINFFTFNSGNTNLGFVFLPNGSKADPNYRGQLYGGTVNNPNSFTPIGNATAFAGSVGNGAGIINSGNVTASNALGGDTFFYQLRAWNTAAGATYEAAAANPGVGLVGVSSAIQVTLGGTNLIGNLFTTPQANQFPFFSLSPVAVPEPGTIALASIAAVGMILVRRRKN